MLDKARISFSNRGRNIKYKLLKKQAETALISFSKVHVVDKTSIHKVLKIDGQDKYQL